MGTKAAPEKARKGKKRPGTKSKLTVDAIGDGVGDDCVDAGGVERGAVHPPIAYAQGLWKTCREEAVLRSRVQSIR
jgi:hypothetical protein